MPFSSESGKNHIRNIMSKVKHDKVLDVGCGSGTYAKMFSSSNFTGIEVWQPYVDQYKLRGLYNPLIVKDARAVDYSTLGRFDVAIAGDVLEHMSEIDAKAVLHNLRQIADTVIVSIPIGHYPQDEYEGNPYERHITDNWTDAHVRAVFGEPSWSAIENEIGVYCWSNQKIGLKIAVYGISKNEEKFVARWAQSAQQADLILLADTGSDDKTVEIAKQNGVEVHHIHLKPWRFDHARNAALCLIPGDFDVCVSLDIDEILEPGWREEIERLWQPDTTRMRYIFDWGMGKKFYHVKIHSRHSHFWKHACHEVPVTDMRTPEKFCFTEKQMVTHYPDHSKSRAQYFDILKVAVEEDPSCPRNAFYWARELSYYAKWDEALVALKKYLDMPSATWNCERCYAYLTMARCYEALGNPVDREKSLLKAAMEAPETREPWVAMADMCYQQGRWPECFAYAMKAVNIKNRANNYTEDPNCWGWRPHDFAAIAAFRLGLTKAAIEQGKIAVELEPGDDRLKNNLSWYLGEQK